MIFKIIKRAILCIIYLFLAYCFAYVAKICFAAPAVPCDDWVAILCSAFTFGRISACDCAAFMTAYGIFWGILFAILAASCLLGCILRRKPKKPSPSTQRIVTKIGTQPQPWWRKYNGKEYNPISDDYVIAGISDVKIGNQLGDVIEPVPPGARILTNRGEDLDCIIFRDGNVTKYKSFLGIEQTITAVDAASDYPQYYPDAINWFNNNPKP